MTTLDFAGDEAAVNFLKNDRKIRNMTFIGHSEGGHSSRPVPGWLYRPLADLVAG